MERLPYKVCKDVYDRLKFIPNGPEQAAPVMAPDRFPCIVGGERSGKSVSAEKILLPHVLALPYHSPQKFFDSAGKSLFDLRYGKDKPRDPDFVIFGPNYKEPRVEFEYLEDDLKALGKLADGHTSKPSDGPYRLVTTDGVVVTTWSLEKPESVRAIELEGALVVEAGGVHYGGIERVRGRVSSTRGFVVFSGCLRGDSLVATSKGLLSLEEMEWAENPVGATVRGQRGFGQVSQWHHNGIFPTKRIKTKYGLEIEGTLHHKMLVRGPGTAGLTWRRLDQLKVGDRAAISLSVGLFGKNHLDTDDAYLAGLYLGDGSCEQPKTERARSYGRVTITCAPDETETHQFLASRGFTQQKDAYHWRSTKAGGAIYRAGVNLGWKAATKEIPLFIRMADKETVAAFLSGLFDSDGCAKKNGHVTLSAKNRRLLEQVQSLLINFGLLGGVGKKVHTASINGNPEKEYVGYTLSLSGGLDFQEKIGFRLTRKADRCIAAGRRQRLPAHQTDIGEFIGGRIWGEYIFAPVVSIEDSECDTYDLSVPNGNSYTANGIVVHNTIEASQQWWKDWLVEGQRENDKGIVSYSIPSWANRFKFPGGESDPEIISWRKFLGEDLFLERCAAVARPPRHRVLKEFTPALVGVLTPPEDAIHEVWVDPGYASAYAVLFVDMWKNADGDLTFYLNNELYEQNLTNKDIIHLCQRMPNWDKIHTGVIDIGAKGHRDSNESALEVWDNLTRIRFEKKMWPENTQIDRLNSSASIGHIVIDPKCKGLLAEAGLGPPVFPEMHPWRFASDRDGRIVSEKPEDRWNHSSKALAYGLLRHLGVVEHRRRASSFNRLTGRGLKDKGSW